MLLAFGHAVRLSNIARKACFFGDSSGARSRGSPASHNRENPIRPISRIAASPPGRKMGRIEPHRRKVWKSPARNSPPQMEWSVP